MAADMDVIAPTDFDTGFEGAFGQLDAGIDANWGDLGSAFTAINQHSVTPSTTGQTVSPKDIFRDPGASAPPSTAFTNLTSPDIDESPYLMDSFDTSPIFNNDGSMAASDNWYSLFPDSQEKSIGAEDLDRTLSTQSLTQTNSSGNSPAPMIIESRRKSGVDKSPPNQSHSSVAGVKPRRRKGPLLPITVTDPGDKAAIKRARNTMAARDSRQRKVDHVQSLERKIAELEEQNAKMSASVDKYQSLYGPLDEASSAESQ